MTIQFIKGGKVIQSAVFKERGAGPTRASWRQAAVRHTVIWVRITPTFRCLTYITICLFDRGWVQKIFLTMYFICKEFGYYFDTPNHF